MQEVARVARGHKKSQGVTRCHKERWKPTGSNRKRWEATGSNGKYVMGSNGKQYTNQYSTIPSNTAKAQP